jgi:hypothetical protein
MSNDWNRGDWEDGESEEHPWSPELSFGTPDAWRGEAGSPDADDSAWRGDQHAADWPETFAGPEYLMWKRLADSEES